MNVLFLTGNTVSCTMLSNWVCQRPFMSQLVQILSTSIRIVISEFWVGLAVRILKSFALLSPIWKTASFLNFGSAVTGAEVFLKAIAITRNIGYPVRGFTTANFDLIPLGKDYRSPVGKDNPEYYYRPRKNIVNRPTSLNGIGLPYSG